MQSSLFVVSPLALCHSRSRPWKGQLLFPQQRSGLGMEVEQQWPLPLTPTAGEHARGIEYERAMTAEAAKNAGPAFSEDHVIYEDEWLLVINKPCGIYSGHVLESASNRSNSPESPMHLHLANRLDRDTSGVIVITKCKKAAGQLTLLFEKRRVRKTYLGLSIGPSPTWNEILVESGHGRSRWGLWRVYSKADVGRKLPENAVVREMSTKFKILSVGGTNCASSSFSSGGEVEKLVAGLDQNRFSIPHDRENAEVLVRAYPFTGRTHQIRLHCQFLGLPLCGDVKYGGPLFWDGIKYDTHMLHAESLSVEHPITANYMHFFAPLPCWAADTCREPVEASQDRLERDRIENVK